MQIKKNKNLIYSADLKIGTKLNEANQQYQFEQIVKSKKKKKKFELFVKKIN